MEGGWFNTLSEIHREGLSLDDLILRTIKRIEAERKIYALIECDPILSVLDPALEQLRGEHEAFLQSHPDPEPEQEQEGSNARS